MYTDQVPSDRILRKRFYLASLQATDRAVHFARLALGKTISGIVKYKYKFQIINDNDSEADLNQLNKEEERVKHRKDCETALWAKKGFLKVSLSLKERLY